MTRTPLNRLVSRTVGLLRDDVDTDQIIPARFLKGTTKEGLGKALFADWRGEVFTGGDAAGTILVTGRNFGCGSSREHAVWALLDRGFRAVVAPSFADIFRGNALQNGLLPVALERAAHEEVVRRIGEEVTIDLGTSRLTLPGGTALPFPIEPFPRYCLMRGSDPLAFLLDQGERIAAFEAQRRNP
jgi:3-isopropylmalate/(R)-2-methylmalate dehydratase small subunit